MGRVVEGPTNSKFIVLQTMGNLGSSDVDSRLEEQLIDGILYAFQEQTQEVHVVLTNWV